MNSVTRTLVLLVATAAGSLAATAPARAQGAVVYKCPPTGSAKTPLYTDALSPKEAIDKGCKTIDNAPITVMETVKPRRTAPPVTSSGSASPNSNAFVNPIEQRQRDSESRRILEGELIREQSRLEESLKEYNNGQPERLGNERNYQKYIDRTADLKSSIERRQSDIEAIKREISKLPQQ